MLDLDVSLDPGLLPFCQFLCSSGGTLLTASVVLEKRLVSERSKQKDKRISELKVAEGSEF